MTKAKPAYTLKISRKTVDKLGVKLYDKVALVIAELVSNSYDADAETVMVNAPAGQFLATKKAGGVADRGLTIEVEDDGIGMDPSQLSDFYLIVGADRRDTRGDKSPGGRPVMGRKGVGKLAPFGICRTIEIISAGGPARGTGKNKEYQVGHIILNYDGILAGGDNEHDYHPTVGSQDRTWRRTRGTKVILRDFLTRRVPDLADLAEEIAQRFGMATDPQNWAVMLADSGDSSNELQVTPLNIPTMPGTKITFSGETPTLATDSLKGYRVNRQTAAREAGIESKPGFELEEKYYPIVGWVAYGEESAKGVRAGVRVYCRGKIATQTLNFDIGSGFHGEFQVKSYLIGELHCDWLDEDEDLIHTDRQNIQWSSDVGAAFQQWGQGLVREIGYMALKPAQEKTFEIFKKSVDLDASLNKMFPNEEQADVRKRARDLAELVAKKLSPDQAKDSAAAAEVLNVATSFAPHFALSQELAAAAESTQQLSIGDVVAILARARIAEAMTLGEIASRRLKLITRFETLVADTNTVEDDLQKLLEEAPWLVRPEWTPISANRQLETVRGALERYLSDKFDEKVYLSKIKHPTKRPDFVMIGAVGPLQIVEIKKPSHRFASADFDRLFRYIEAFDEFFAEPANQKTLSGVQGYTITLVADGTDLNRPQRSALEGEQSKRKFEQISWDVLTDRAKHVHDDFIQGLEKAGLRIAED